MRRAGSLHRGVLGGWTTEAGPRRRRWRSAMEKNHIHNILHAVHTRVYVHMSLALPACVRKRNGKQKMFVCSIHRGVRKNQPPAERDFCGNRNRKSGCGKCRAEKRKELHGRRVDECMSTCVAVCVGHMSSILQHFDLLAQILAHQYSST